MIEYDNCMFLNIFVAIFNKIYNDIMWYKRIYIRCKNDKNHISEAQQV